MSSARIRYLLNKNWNCLPKIEVILRLSLSALWGSLQNGENPQKHSAKPQHSILPLHADLQTMFVWIQRNPKLGMSALHSVTHPKKMNPTDILRGSTLPVASTPLLGKEEYPVFNWQLSQRPLCLQLPSPCSKRHTVFNRLPKMGFKGVLAQHPSQCLWCVTIIWGWRWSTNIHCQHSPEKSRQHNQVTCRPKSRGIKKLTRLVCLV